MSLRIDKVQLEIIINNDEARKKLRLLDDEMRLLQKDLKKLPEGTQEWKDKNALLVEVQSKYENVKREIGITSLTLKELSAHQRELNGVLLNMNPRIPEYQILQQELAETTARIKELRNGAQQAEGIFAKMFGAFTLGSLAAGAIQNLVFGIKDYVKTGIEGAIKMADAQKLLLHALDGNKSKLDELVALAVKVSKTTIYTKIEVLEGEKFLAMQNRSQEQIKKTITAATELSTVAGISLDQAIRDLDGTMEGKLGKSLLKLEKDFKNLSREQLYNGTMIDLVNEKYKGYAEAESETTEGKINQLTKAHVAFGRAIGELFTNSGGGYFDGMIESATSFFVFLRNNIGVLATLTKAIVVLGAGFLAYKVTLASITAYESVSTAVKTAYTAVTTLFTRAKLAETAAVASNATANAAETVTATAATAATAAQATATEVATEATIALNTATKASPWGMIIGLIAGAAAVLMTFASRASTTQDALDEISAKATENTASERVNLEGLVAIANNEALSKEKRLEAIKKINAISPDYLGGITLENIKTAASTKAIDDYIKSLSRKAEAQASFEALVDIQKKIDALQNGSAQATLGLWTQTWNLIKAGGNTAAVATSNVLSQIEATNEGMKKLMDQKNAILAQAKKSEPETTAPKEAYVKKLSELNLQELNIEKDRLIAMGENIDKTDQMRLKEISRLVGSKEREAEKLKTHNDKVLADYESLQKAITDLAGENLTQRMNDTQKEIHDAEHKYDVLIDKARQFLKDTPELAPKKKQEINSEMELLEIKKQETLNGILTRREEEFSKEVTDIHEKLRVARLSIADKEIASINLRYDTLITEQKQAISTTFDDLESSLSSDFAKGLISQKEYNEQHINLVKQRADAECLIQEDIDRINKARDQEAKKVLLDEERKFQDALKSLEGKEAHPELSKDDQEILKIQHKYAKLAEQYKGDAARQIQIAKATDDEIEDYKKNKAKITEREIAKFTVQSAKLLSDTIFDIANTKRKEVLDSQISFLETEKEAELSNKNLTSAQKATIEAKYHAKEAAIKTKAWKDEKKAAEEQAIINGALAILNIWATTPKVDFGVSTVILIAASIAATIAQLAKIQSTHPPQFQTGGFTGLGKDDQPAGIVHKGEYVIPSWQMQDPSIRHIVTMIEESRVNKRYTEGGFVAKPGQLMQDPMAEFTNPVVQQNYVVTNSMGKDAFIDHLTTMTQVIIDFKEVSKSKLSEIAISDSNISNYSQSTSTALKDVAVHIVNQKQIKTNQIANTSNGIENSKVSNGSAKVISNDYPNFDIPMITRAIKLSPSQMNMDFYQKQTQEILHQINIPQLIEKSMKATAVDHTPEFTRVIGEFSKKMEVMEQLKKTLDTGVRTHIVYQDILDAQDTIKLIHADTSR